MQSFARRLDSVTQSDCHALVVRARRRGGPAESAADSPPPSGFLVDYCAATSLKNWRAEMTFKMIP